MQTNLSRYTLLIGHIAQLIRYKNLLFILLTQKLLEYAIVIPILQTFGFEHLAMESYFWWLNLSTILIAAGGYTINDYFDLKIDRINRPKDIVVGLHISKKSTILLYQTVTFLGVGMGIGLAYWISSITFGFIVVITAGLLWFYATSYKRQLIIGNIVVSSLTGMSLLLVGVVAIALLHKSYTPQLLLQTPIPTQIYAWIGGFSGFAFLLTWIREIIKDIEDIEGDKDAECRTMPILWGMGWSKLVVVTLILVAIGLLLFVTYRYIELGQSTTKKYLFVALIIPLLTLIATVIKAKEKIEFSNASTLCKTIMGVGILYSLIFYYYQAQLYNLSFFGLFWVQ